MPEVLEPWLPAEDAPVPVSEVEPVPVLEVAPLGVERFMSLAPVERPLCMPDELVDPLDPLVDCCAVAAPPMTIAPTAAAMVISFIGSLLSAEINHQLPAPRHVPELTQMRA